LAIDLVLPAGTEDLTPAQRAFRAVLTANLWDLDDPNVLPGLTAALTVPLTLTFDASGRAMVATLAIGNGGRWGSYASQSPISLAHTVRERLIEIFGPAAE
jgi:hypothetical protein